MFRTRNAAPPDGPDEPPIEPVYPLETLLALLVGAGAAWKIGREIVRRTEEPAPTQPPKPQEKPPERPPAQPQKPLPKPDKIPKDWKQLPSKKNEGVRYRDPENPHNEVRVQRGDPEVSNPSQQEDYVRWKKDGQWLDKDGNPSMDPEETHIPFE